ncbi:hypothetical protein [Acidovorax sp. FG27]|uniref:hypothetical protein n=1 Tax=Acidovorax sp. FG27 TaxID=3133652 RepID=UPI00334053B6
MLSAFTQEAEALARDLCQPATPPSATSAGQNLPGVCGAGRQAAWSADARSPLLTACAQRDASSTALRDAASAHARTYQLTLLCGLEDVPARRAQEPGTIGEAGMDPAAAEAGQSRLRSALSEAGIAYQVLYGDAQARRLQALAAIHAACGTGPVLPASPAEPAPAAGAAMMRERRARLRAYGCEKCSDPECEHQLFRQLLAAR